MLDAILVRNNLTLGQRVIQAVTESQTRRVLMYLGASHDAYEALFWPACLGQKHYALYMALRALASAQLDGLAPPVTVEMVATVMGGGDRHTILGRAPRSGRQAQPGLIQALVQEGIARHWIGGYGRERTHRFEVLMSLPILSFAQAGCLDARIREMHEHYLGAIRAFDLPTWRTLDELSFIPLVVEQLGYQVVC